MKGKRLKRWEPWVDSTGIERMQGKTLHLNLKVEDIAPRTANLLKQEMLALGVDAAVDGRGLDCEIESTTTLLMGTQKQLEKLALKLNQYPKLEPLARALADELERPMMMLVSAQR